jgi:hypothetical protein
MAKTKASKRKSSQAWSSSEHSHRTAKRIASLQKKQRKKLAVSESIDDNADVPQQQQHQQQHQRRRPLLSSAVPSNTYKRTHLAHDNHDKIELSKLRLATSQIQRQIDALASRLSNWDPQSTTDDMGVETAERDSKMSRDVENRRMDRQARDKADAERILIEAERGVNCSSGRRKGE